MRKVGMLVWQGLGQTAAKQYYYLLAPGIYEKGAIKGTKYLVQAYKLGLKVKQP